MHNMHRVIFCSSSESKRSISSEKFREESKYRLGLLMLYKNTMILCRLGTKLELDISFAVHKSGAAILHPLNSGSDIVLKGNTEFAITPFL